ISVSSCRGAYRTGEGDGLFNRRGQPALTPVPAACWTRIFLKCCWGRPTWPVSGHLMSSFWICCEFSFFVRAPQPAFAHARGYRRLALRLRLLLNAGAASDPGGSGVTLERG